MKTTEVFYLAMAALGGYAAYLAIKEKQQKKQQFAGLLDGGFSVPGTYDFYSNSSYDWLALSNDSQWPGI
jgi:hypothetical protein